MKRFLLFLTIVALVLPAVPRAHADDVSVDFFYNNLSGGSWIEVGDYGYCWQPDVAASDSNWRPYSDGYWTYTDLGWTWVSYEDFGWATYHYGRWARLSDLGWVWVPGSDSELEWGPAWVSWRTGGDYVGWAPLPPHGHGMDEGRAITGHVDVEFDIGPSYYNFIDVRYIGEPVLRERIIERSQNVTYVNQTVNVTNITHKNKVVYNYGPDFNVVSARSSRPIQRLKLERQSNVDFSVAAKSGAMTKVEGDRLVVGAPLTIRKSAKQVAPPTVKVKVAQAKLDHGWSGVSDPKAQEQLKKKMQTEDSKKIPPHRLHRLLDRLDHLLPRLERRHIGDVLRERLAGDGHAVAVQEPALEQVLHQRGRAADGCADLPARTCSARLQIGQQRHAIARALEVVQRQRHVRASARSRSGAARRWSIRRPPSPSPARSRTISW